MKLRTCDYCGNEKSIINITFVTPMGVVDSMHLCYNHSSIGNIFERTCHKEKCKTFVSARSGEKIVLYNENKIYVY